MSWFGRTIRNLSSNASSTFKFMPDNTKGPIAKRFHEMVKNHDQNFSVEQCVEYFVEHFGGFESKELEEFRINRETTYLLNQFVQSFSDKIKNENYRNMGFAFLDSAIQIFIPDQKNISNLYNFIHQVLNTNDENILMKSMVFIAKCLSFPSLAALFYQSDNIIQLWLTLFVNNPTTSKLYGSLFTASAENIAFKNYELYKPFFAQVIDSFKSLCLVRENAMNAIQFIAIISSKINSGNFFIEFFTVSNIFFLGFSTLNVFSLFLNCKTHDPEAPWKAINEICKNENVSFELLESALDVVYDFKYSPMILLFSFSPFIKRAKEISFDSQKKMFDIIDRFPLSSKLDFFAYSIPPWVTGINSELLSQMVKKNDWGKYPLVMLSTLVLKPEYHIFKEHLAEDQFLSDIVKTLIDKTSTKEEIAMILYQEFIKLAYDGIQIGNYVVEKMTENDNTIIHVEQFINVLQDGLVCDSIFDIYSQVARKNLIFVLSFLEYDGISILFNSLNSDSGLNFLASLASNGPYESIDNYIINNYENSYLSQLSEEKIYKLMMGIPQNSTSKGLLRIPSLTKYVKNIELTTQNDRFIFGISAEKYGVDSIENLKKCAPTYMDPKVALDFCKDPDTLLSITSPLNPHFSVFQCHFDTPHCYATFKLDISTIFWIFIEDVLNKTVILKSPFGEISIDEKSSITFFGQVPVHIEPKKWHMITLTATDWTFQQKKLVCHLDSNQIAEVNGDIGAAVTFGSETENNAVYYLSASFQTFNNSLSPLDIKQIYKKGPGVFCPTSIKMKPGFQYVPYKGISKYIDRLGGQEFIFNLMKEEGISKSDLQKLIQSAFNMLHLGMINDNLFFNALRYILIIKEEIIDDQIEFLIYKELDSDPNKKWSYSMRLFSDYNILSSDKMSIHLNILNEIINFSKEDSSQLFHFLIDSFIIFDLQEPIKKNVLKAINAYINIDPFILNMILLAISVVVNVSSNTKLSLNEEDPNNDNFESSYEKQEELFQIIEEHLDLFALHVKFESALYYASIMRDEMALKLLYIIAKASIINPTYFEIDIFKKYMPFFFLLSQYHKLWYIILIFYTSQCADSIDDFADIDIFRPSMTDIILDLLAYSLRYDISTSKDMNNLFSFKLVKIIIKLLIQGNINFIDYLDQIQRLASLGFDQEDITPIPFSIEEDIISSKVIKKLSTIKDKSINEPFKMTRIHPLDPSMFEETSLYLSNFENLNNKDLSDITIDEYFKKTRIPDNINDIANSETVQIISNLIGNVFVQKSIQGSLNNKIFVKLLINSADVNPLISVMMHKKIVLSIFSLPIASQIPEEHYDNLIKFITYRILEGWWDNDIFIIFQASFLRKTKSTKHFLTACIFQCNDVNIQLRILKEFCLSSKFQEYLNDQLFYECFITMIGRYEIISNESFQSLKIELISSLSKNSELYQNLQFSNNDKFLEWAENNGTVTFLNDLKKQSIYNSKILREARIDITKPPCVKSYIKYSSSRNSNALYVRRAFRLQFFKRFNTSNLEIESAILNMFLSEYRFKCTDNHSNKDLANAQKVMIVSAPHPLVVPQKLIPLSFDFKFEFALKNSDENGFKLDPTCLPSSVHSRKYPTKVSELSLSQSAPKCLEKWKLPSFIKISLSSLFTSFVEATSPLFECSLLMSPEKLPGVAAFNNETFSIVLNASLIRDTLYNICMSNNKDELNVKEDSSLSENTNSFNFENPSFFSSFTPRNSSSSICKLFEELVLHESSNALCHYSVIENAVHGIYGETKMFMHHPVISFKFSDVLIAVPRRYVYQQQEIDLFFATGFHLTLIMKENDRKQLLSHLNPPHNVNCNYGPFHTISILSKSIEKVTKLWKNSEMSTYEYLLYLNTISGRSFNDLSQYPVFPWILGDFNSSEPVIKRDLSKPMGAQTKAREIRHLNNFNDTEPHFHYGTHYSNPTAVMHFLMRIEPFTFFNLYVHSGFDHRDRQFVSIDEAWKSASESNFSDLIELIPEFYCLPAMFENPNSYEFQCRTDGTSLSTVIIPKWITDQPNITPSIGNLLFIWQMRSTLESPEVSSKIGSWIDLIFGYKQRGQAAIDAINVFQPQTYDLSYLSNEDEEHKKAIYDAINQFGQCPVQLFTTPHPQCERTISKNIINSKFLVTQLEGLGLNCVNIQFHKEMPFGLQKYEHYIGSGFTLARVWDGYIKISSKEELYPSVDACSATGLSSDRLILAVASRLGVINVYSCSAIGELTIISKLISPSFKTQSIAVSTQYGMIVTASFDAGITTFDYSTGLIMKSVFTEDTANIIQVIFDEMNNFIIAITPTKILIFGLDLRLILTLAEDFSPKFTCISSADGGLWLKNPLYVTGHDDGSVFAWKANILKRRLNPTLLMQNRKSPITAVAIFANSKAVISTDSNGATFLASIIPLQEMFISSRAFEKCRSCGSSIKGGLGYRCMNCGLYVCKSCIASKRPTTCIICKTRSLSEQSNARPEILNPSTKLGDEEEEPSTNEKGESVYIDSGNSTIEALLIEQKQLHQNEQHETISKKNDDDEVGTVTLLYRDVTYDRLQNVETPTSYRMNFRHSI